MSAGRKRRVGRIRAARHQDAPDPVIEGARVHRPPGIVEIDLEPGAETVTAQVGAALGTKQVAAAVARGNVERPAEGDGDMGEIIHRGRAVLQRFARGPQRPQPRRCLLQLAVQVIAIARTWSQPAGT